MKEIHIGQWREQGKRMKKEPSIVPIPMGELDNALKEQVVCEKIGGWAVCQNIKMENWPRIEP